MCLQQSEAFKILHTRLKALPYAFGDEHFEQMALENPYSEVQQHVQSGTQIGDGDRMQDIENVDNGINFASLLQQFKSMQHRHHLHLRA